MLGTKLRALYQRRKGRDLFDLYWAIVNNNLDFEKLIHCYHEYMEFVVKQLPTKKMFLLNMDEKIIDSEFTGDIFGLLRPGVQYDNKEAYEVVKRIIEKL